MPVVSQVQQMTTKEIEIEKFITVLEEVHSLPPGVTWGGQGRVQRELERTGRTLGTFLY